MTKKWIIIGLIMALSFVPGICNADIETSISGHVTGEDTGSGVADVYVVAYRGGAKGIAAFAKTDKNGLYVLKNLLPDKYGLFFVKEKSNYLIMMKALIIDLPRGKNIVNANYVLKLGGAVSGTVYDFDGVTPLGGVTVLAKVPGDLEMGIDGIRAVTTDAGGGYILQGLPESDVCDVKVNILGETKQIKRIQILKGQITRDVNFVVKRDDTNGIAGRIKTAATYIYRVPEIENCSESDEGKIRTAYDTLMTTIKEENSCLSNKMKNALPPTSPVVIRCYDGACSGFSISKLSFIDTCAFTLPFSSAAIILCPSKISNESDPDCGCSASVLLHEMLHTAGYDNEKTPQGCEKKCFQCSKTASGTKECDCDGMPPTLGGS
jgi:hypothetical protein